ncbi:hypothetical protein Nocox_12105 [Nonomuraea coxensis DSM 45129]|uniref:Copper(I)-binding protein n=1 Tax=Nonomuraea coxensis DSM 45129 TaxID=1122611 RepID=A0ABX8TXD4_9ACTN|nr:hypothetical protein [Nonomuraea coxensis]QYC40039.1 hypothetical protein Nocox_12105 [Nonomuraea coxensis DSM 45129]
MRSIAVAVSVMALAALSAGCTVATIDTAQHAPQSDGADADASQTLHLRNMLLVGASDPAVPSQENHLYGVLINNGHKSAQLERITVEGGGSVQLPGPITVPPNQPVGTGERPIATVTGVRGGTVAMTFTFTGASPVRLQVPVMERTGTYAHLTPSPGVSPPGSPTGFPSGSPTASPAASPTGTLGTSPSPTS